MLIFVGKVQEGDQSNFAAADKESETITRINNTLMTFGGFVHALGPLVIVAINYFKGTLRPEMWVLPFNVK